MTAAELREQAVAKFKEANALVEGKELADIDADTEKKFDTLMAEAAQADEQFVKLAGKEGKVATLKERLDFYTQAATGKGIDWSKISGGEPEKGLPHYDGGLIVPGTGKSLGDLYVASKEYEELLGSKVLDSDNAKFKSVPFTPEMKATSDILRSAAGTAAALVTPQYLPGVLPLPQRPLTVRDLFSQATTTSDTLSYARQSAFDNGAAAVAEATSVATGAKPQSSIAWTRQTSPIETIATWMAATRRALGDAGQIRSLIDNQLTLMLQLEEEDQLLNGDGTSPNISGLLDQTGLQTLDLSAAAAERANLDGLRTAKRLVRTGAARAQADGVVLNPVDSEEFDLMVDNEGRYRAGDPFASGPENPPIWRMRRVESEAVAAGTALVGAFRQGATVFQREPITILSSDSHSDFFVRNLIAVLAEERLGLAVFFPTAFVEVTLKAWPTS